MSAGRQAVVGPAGCMPFIGAISPGPPPPGFVVFGLKAARSGA